MPLARGGGQDPVGLPPSFPGPFWAGPFWAGPEAAPLPDVAWGAALDSEAGF